MTSYLVGVVAAVLVTCFIIEMLRRGVLKEKFAALWLVVASGMCLFALFPPIVVTLARWVGVTLPSNFLFALAGIVLLIVSVQLSFEVSRVEARTRRLAEEVALLKEEVERRGNENS